MAVNTGLTVPPVQSSPFTDGTGNLTRFGMQLLQSVVNAIQAAQAAIVTLQTSVAAIPTLPTPSSPSYANDAAAEAGGVKVGGYYRNGSIIQMRIT